MDSNPSTPQRTASSASRKSKVQPMEVRQILTSTGSNATGAKSSPVEHVASPNSPTHSISSSVGRASFQSHGRAMSSMSSTTDSKTATTRPNRFSLSFPVQPSNLSSPVRGPPSPTRDAKPVVPDQLASPTGTTDTSFLTAIATQERRVLELKEELQRAEVDLTKLKRQWAQHEANKKRNDARRVTKLQPLQTALPASDKQNDEEDGDGGSAWMQAELERRKALINGRERSNRTVFSGSRHTRTLSLLSPARDEYKPPPRQALPPRKDSLSTNTARKSAEADPSSTSQSNERPKLMTRASTNSDLTSEVAETASPDVSLPDNLDKSVAGREDILRTGKKFANDFRDGLWTFFEDLRQATVGDEAATGAGQPIMPPNMRRQSSQASGLSAKTARKQHSRSSLRPSSRDSSKASAETRRPSPNQARSKSHVKSATQGALPDLADPSFWTEHTAIASVQPVPAAKKSPSIRGHHKNISKVSSSGAESEAWDTWDDSPSESRTSSAASETHTVPSSVSGTASPRMSVQDSPSAARMSASAGASGKDPIPWPALNKPSTTGPGGKLRRTASHLMNEWERSLTPSPGQEFKGEEDYMGFGAEAAATEIERKKD
ncbi:hypothetical protein KC331_g932 [Hortaea werneckii]|uniref:DUF4048 domain-containing protein n=1 Tax=Hortaea werneckii TaxID=91943 RepID=A0A3M7BSD1_HORWE|nr:hypothetical protein KC331_g932 [Hortaea werneckii]KAI7717140.1 hypothetical protein KC353_g4824 [Hortaea werneckii]RMY42574.1 hypothetical protein D0865_11865 [Hortaea werneckii]